MIRIKGARGEGQQAKREMPVMTVNQDILGVAYQVAGIASKARSTNQARSSATKAVNELKEEVKRGAQYPQADKFAISRPSTTCRKSIPHQRARQTADGWPAVTRIYANHLRSWCSAAPVVRRSSSVAKPGARARDPPPIEEAQNIDAYGGGETSKSFLLHYISAVQRG
jgi:polyribonucleotide nucleotidyltransferase